MAASSEDSLKDSFSVSSSLPSHPTPEGLHPGQHLLAQNRGSFSSPPVSQKSGDLENQGGELGRRLT